jgi:Flp pilus assembly protein TadD
MAAGTSRNSLTTGKLTSPTRDILAVIAPHEAERELFKEAGKALIAKRRFADAARIFELLVLAVSDNGFFNRCFGICCEELDRLEEAAAALDRALAADPSDTFALLARASVRLRRGDRNGAAQDAHAAVDAVGDENSDHARRVRLLHRQLSRHSGVENSAIVL